MSIKFVCKNCDRKRRLDDSFRGKKVRCKCGQTTRLPKSSSTIERADEIFDSDMLEAARQEQADADMVPIELEQVPIYEPDAGLDPLKGVDPLQGIDPLQGVDPLHGQEPVQGAATYTSSPKQRPMKVESVQGFSKSSIIRLLLAMVSGTLALLFAFLVFAAISDFLLPMFEQQREFRESRGREIDDNLPSFVGVTIFGILGIVIASIYGLAGLAQFGISWMQFIKQNRVHAWIDMFVSAISVICIVTLLAFFLYANYQIFEMRKTQTDAIKIQQEHFGTDIERSRRLDDQMQGIDKTLAKTRWLIFREVFVHCLFPATVITLSMYRFMRHDH